MEKQKTFIDLLIELGVAKHPEHCPFDILSQTLEKKIVQRMNFSVEIHKRAILLVLEVLIMEENHNGKVIKFPYGYFNSLFVAVRVANSLNRIFWKISD